MNNLDEKIKKTQESINLYVNGTRDYLHKTVDLYLEGAIKHHDTYELNKAKHDGRLDAYFDNDIDFAKMDADEVIIYADVHKQWMIDLAMESINYSNLDVNYLDVVQHFSITKDLYFNEKKKLQQLKKIKRRGH